MKTIEEKRAYWREYYAKNKEKHALAVKKWTLENPEKVAEYYCKNKEKINEYYRKRYQEDENFRMAQMKAIKKYDEKNKEYRKKRYYEDLELSREKNRIAARLFRERKKIKNSII